jgi:hypothetical protein
MQISLEFPSPGSNFKSNFERIFLFLYEISGVVVISIDYLAVTSEKSYSRKKQILSIAGDCSYLNTT